MTPAFGPRWCNCLPPYGFARGLGRCLVAVDLIDARPLGEPLTRVELSDEVLAGPIYAGASRAPEPKRPTGRYVISEIYITSHWCHSKARRRPLARL